MLIRTANVNGITVTYSWVLLTCSPYSLWKMTAWVWPSKVKSCLLNMWKELMIRNPVSGSQWQLAQFSRTDYPRFTDSNKSLRSWNLRSTPTPSPEHFCSFTLLCIKKPAPRALVAHIYNPSYSGGRDQKDHWSQLRQIVLPDPISEKPLTKKKKKSGGVTQG
jgi:hypothetical protein